MYAERLRQDAVLRALWQAPLAVLVLDRAGRIEEVSPFFERTTGYGLADVRGAEWAALTPENERERLARALTLASAGEAAREHRSSIVTRGGAKRALEWTIEPLREGEGPVTGILATGLDVTERLRTQGHLEGTLRETQRLARLGSWELDLVTDRLAWSDEIFEIFEIDPDRFGASYEAFLAGIHPEDRAAVDRAYRASVANRTPYELTHRLRMPDGRIKWVQERGQTEYDATGRAVRSVGTVQDVTAQEQAQLRLRNTLDGMSAFVGLFDLDGNTLEVNRAPLELAGLRREDVLGKPFVEARWVGHSAEEKQQLGLAHARAAAGEIVHQEIHLRVGRDAFRVFDAVFAPLLDASGRVEGVVGSGVDVTERHASARKLRESEEHYRRLFTDAIEGIFRTSHDGTVLDANPAFARLLGYDSPDELIGKSVLSLYVDPADRERLEQRHPGEDTLLGEPLRWRRKSGEPILVELHGRVFRDERGEPARYQGFVRDVTAQQQYGAALQVLSSGLSRLAGRAFFDEVALQLASIVGAEIGFVGALQGSDASAPRALRLLGCALDGKAVSPPDSPLAGTPCEQVLEERSMVFPCDVQRFFPDDGRLAQLHVQGYVAVPLLDKGGHVIGLVGVMTRTPIAEPARVESIAKLFALRVGAELERQRGEERFASVFEHAPDALLIVAESGRILLSNAMAESLLGYRREELAALHIDALVPEPQRSGHAGLRAGMHTPPSTRRMGSSRPQVSALRKDGTLLPVEVSLSPLQSEDGGRPVVAAIRDVSARVRAAQERALLEDQLRQAQKMESLGTLAGGIAHDFNNMLAAIVVNVDLARAGGALPGPTVESLDEIAEASARASDLVRQILAFSRRQPTSRTIKSARAAVEEAAKLLRATLPAGVQLVTEPGPDSPNVLIDPTQLHQVLMNLGTNAWQAIEHTTGTITFRLETVSVGAAPPAAGMEPGTYACIAVTDDGKGMDEATVRRVFEPFFTTKGVGKGTGLGLSVVHGIVTDHGGAVTVDSAPGSGTTFCVYLPAVAGLPTAEPTPQSPRHGGGRVLLIDDEELLVRALGRTLRRLGYEVTSFLRPLDAVAAVRAEPSRFDVVITDQNMPELSGVEVAHALDAIRPGLPVVLVSGNRVSSDEELASASISYRLDKPYTSVALSRVLEKALGRA